RRRRGPRGDRRRPRGARAAPGASQARASRGQRMRVESAVQVPYIVSMATRTKRIELRADPEREALIAEAAAGRELSVSSFVLQAAAEEASRVLARANLTLMPAAQFDAFVSALDQPDAAPRLAAAAARERRYQRR